MQIKVTEAHLEAPFGKWCLMPGNRDCKIPKEIRGNMHNGDANRQRKAIFAYVAEKQAEEQKRLRGRTKDVILKKREARKAAVVGAPEGRELASASA